MDRRSAAAILLALGGVLAPRLALSAGADRTYRDANIQLPLPEGYLGPSEHVDGPSVSKGFRKPYAGTALNTVILVTVYKLGSSIEKHSRKEREALARETLDDIVSGIEKNRSGFRKGEPRAAVIAGHTGLKIAWSGSVQGIAFEGQVYCILAGTRIYAVQIQDPAGRGGNRMAEAVRAVERMRF